MAEYLIDKAYLVALADAIRKKSGSSSKMTPSAMVSALNNLGEMAYTPPSSSTVINKTGELYTIQDTTFNSLAKAIRNKAGISDKMTPSKMVDVVNGLEEAKKTAFAVYSADDNSLNFYKRAKVPKAGERFDGKIVTEVYTGFETDKYVEYNNVPWYNKYNMITSVKIVDVISPVSTSNWFIDCMSLSTIDLSNLNTEYVVNMSSMFAGCSSITNLNLLNFNTSNVTNMSRMFSSCSSLRSLDVSNFNTSNVTDMEWMFYNCKQLVNINVSNFNTLKVKSMYRMFANCSSLVNLNLSNFNTSNVNSMERMFYRCQSIVSINISKFNTQKTLFMQNMFYGCSSLISLDISSFDTSNVMDMQLIFDNCYKLQQIKLGAKFIWQSINGRLPSPNSNYISNADGKWYALSNRVGYIPKDIPSSKADTYYASKNLLP